NGDHRDLHSFPTRRSSDAGEPRLPEDGELYLHRKSRSGQGAQVDRFADAAWVPAFAEQPLGGNRRLHHAVAEGKASGAGKWSGAGGIVRARSILFDRVYVAIGPEFAARPEDGG